MRVTPEEAGRLVEAASRGDAGAWQELVDAYVGLVWAIIRTYRLEPMDAHDVAQTTWLRLVENIDRLVDPRRVGAWLATTARRECLQVLRQSRRTVLLHAWDEVDAAHPEAQDVDADLLRSEQDESVRQSLEQLPPSCQALLRLLMLDPTPSYEEVAAALGMPLGSIGPTRGRCLAKLKALVQAGGITEGPPRVIPR